MGLRLGHYTLISNILTWTAIAACLTVFFIASLGAGFGAAVYAYTLTIALAILFINSLAASIYGAIKKTSDWYTFAVGAHVLWLALFALVVLGTGMFR